MRQGEVLETVPGVIITQHSGEGKANQHFLRGFNLDHGSDFALTVAGTPVNMPTHAHSQGYSDINFLIPELVAGVQHRRSAFRRSGRLFHGGRRQHHLCDLARPDAPPCRDRHIWFGRVCAASPKIGNGTVLAAFESSTKRRSLDRADSHKKLNGVLRYARGDNVNGFSLTAMGYHGEWNATEASPQRAIDSGLIDRFGSIDQTDGGHTSRYSVGGEWQHGTGATLTKIQAYGLGYDLNLISNLRFT